ncbi:MAG: hypothetical protein WBW99_02080, partial [Pseudolabrys sp.]
MNRRDRKGNCRAEAGGGFPDLSHVVGEICGLGGHGAGVDQAKKPLSTLEIGVDHLGHVLNR